MFPLKTVKNTPLGDDEGLLLNQVGGDGPAGQAGLQAGDIVLRSDRQPINNGNLSSTMQRLGAGRTVEVDFCVMVLP